MEPRLIEARVRIATHRLRPRQPLHRSLRPVHLLVQQLQVCNPFNALKLLLVRYLLNPFGRYFNYCQLRLTSLLLASDELKV